MKNGELWYPVLMFELGIDPFLAPMRVKRLNLETGIDHETGLRLEGCLLGWGKLIWIGDTLYYVYFRDTGKTRPEETNRICQAVGSTFVDLDSSRFERGRVLGPPFEYAGRVSVVERTEDGRFRMVQWIDEKWIDGREILLPSSERVWFDDPQHNRRVLLPLTSQQPVPSTTRSTMELNVVRWGNENVLFLFDDVTKLFAYRRGFEFADEQRSPSALQPANAPPDVSGWVPTSTLAGTDCYATIRPRGDEIFLSLWAGWSNYGGYAKQQIVRYMPGGLCAVLSEEFDSATEGKGLRQAVLAVNPSEDESYLVEFNSWNSFAIRRIAESKIRPSHFVKRGGEREYLMQWVCRVGGLLMAWLLHIAIVIAGAQWVMLRTRSVSPESEMTRASPTRRILADAIDLMIVFLILVLPCWFFLGTAIITLWRNYEVRLCEVLHFDFERALCTGIANWGFTQGILSFITTMFSNVFKSSSEHNIDVLVGWVSCCLFLLGLKSYWEGRSGMTPGKWLLGIRIMKTTLRPAGFASALARNILYCCDFPFLLTPLPAAISMVFSDKSQRLGDRVANTIVVRA